MKTTIRFRRIIVSLTIGAVQCLYAQNYFSSWSERWNNYLHEPENDLTFLHKRYFHDTVRVEEMKEAFLKYKDVIHKKSLYEGYDSVGFPLEGHGRSVMLVSPLKRHPNKKVRECRGVWAYPRKQVIKLIDKNGLSQEKLAERLNCDEERKWLDGEILRLEEPRWYMGFIVSPCVYWEIYDKGKPLADVCSSARIPDFFSYSEVTSFGFGGHWNRRLQAGAHLMGGMCGLSYLNEEQSERTFSVLMYQKPIPKGMNYLERPYTLELLEPEEADKEILRLFHDLKSFIEALPNKTYNPYYTTDFRIMAGRYYRVTVNRCGWLVEDYLKEYK